MRIIAGEFKGFALNSIEGKSTRPTTDFVREMIFATLFDVSDRVVLDLYSGSGALAFEAISRGASHATLVDASEHSIRTILSNAEKLKCKDRILVQKIKAELFVKKTDKKYDLILLDPPYNKDCLNNILDLIFDNDILLPDSTIVIEHSYEEPLKEEYKRYQTKEKRRGKTNIVFLEIE